MQIFTSQSHIRFHNPALFWFGTALVVAGVLAHVPMFMDSAPMGYRMVGMKTDWIMMLGMFAIIVGTLTVAYGLSPRVFRPIGSTKGKEEKIDLRAMDDAPLTAAHWKLIAVLVVALIVDVMKPATLGFVVPGSAEEYGLTKAQAALMPLGGIIGTTIGSLIWGYLGDVIGRRASILLAAIVFIGTSICGAMPSYAWNVVMCFMMGLGAGGLLPIAFALLAEIIPARHRAGLIVLIGGIGTVGGYLAASGAATLLEPTFGWRMLWFIGLPTGIILLILNRYIPESPRYLLMHNNRAEAERIMQYFSIRIIPRDEQDIIEPVQAGIEPQQGYFRRLFYPPYSWLTMSLSSYAVAWGLVNFGFLLWLPRNLRSIGMDVAASDAILAQSALIAFPATALVAWLYHSWSTKGTLVLFALLTVASLGGFAYFGDSVAENTWILSGLIIGLLVSSSGVIALLSPYAAEVYPSRIRATGSGWTAACSKGAGVGAISLAAVGVIPAIAPAAIAVAIPTLFAAALVTYKGIETRGRNLEEIQSE